MYLLFIYLFLISISVFCQEDPEEAHGVKYATDCEVCKYFVIELASRLSETSKSHEVISTGYSLHEPKRTPYKKSELRLVESLDGICDRLLEYNLHKEHTDSRRFAKGMSQTFKTLHGLVDRGVKVDLGIPLELWDKPSAEVSNLKVKCELLLEKHEEDIENWYWKNDSSTDLMDYLCVQRVLKEDKECLYETEDNKKDETTNEKAEDKKFVEESKITETIKGDNEGYCDSKHDTCNKKSES